MRYLFISLFLLIAAICVVAFPRVLENLIGFQKLQEPPVASLDQQLSGEDRTSPRFLRERNQVRLKIRETIPLGEFSRLYLLGEPSIRRQIEQQVGGKPLSDDFPLEAGLELVLRLTPEASAER